MSHRSINVRAFGPVFLALLVLVLTAFPARAATKAERARAAKELVKEALHREVFGLTQDRAELLQEAARQMADYAPAMWHQGYVRQRNRWIKADDLPQLAGQDRRVIAYETVRSEYPDTADGQLALANWCRERELADQERAHLTQVIQHNPDHAEARARLGFRRVNGVWLSQAEINRAAEQTARQRESLAVWAPKLETVLELLRHRSELKQAAAIEKVLAIRDPSAIPAMEAMLAGESERAAKLVVRAMAAMTDHEASLALARHAVYSPWQSVRDLAANELKTRSKHDFVPSLLATMFTPTISRFQVTRAPSGQMLYRHSFVREGQDQRDVMVLDTAYRRVALPGGRRSDTLARALTDLGQNIRAREFSVAEQNRRTQALNERVCSVLNTATEQSLAASPDQWWQWWNQENEVFVEGDKQTRSTYQAQQVAIVDRVPLIDGGGEQSGSQGGQYPLDCLAAGTTVWTAAGPMAIEKIRVGDLVLSQDPETGELALRPVLRTTVRPASKLVKIQAGGMTIETSGGHLFWVAGEGWVRARNISSGTELHGVTSTVRVSSVEEGREERSFNLIVADFNTYFVGPEKVLSHDNTVRQPTNAIVPGLVE